MEDSVIQVLERCVNKIPDECAILYKDYSISYKELWEKSNLISSYFEKKNIYRKVIGVALPGGANLVTSLLGILKSKNIYLPLDMTLPKERLEYMIENSSCEIIITSSCSAPSIDFNLDIIFFDQLVVTPTNKNILSGSDRRRKVKSDDLAYIIYTSGSTGIPKGVMIRHGGLVNAILGRFLYYPGKLNSVLYGSIGFDMSLMIIFQSLLSGGILFILEDSSLLNLDSLSRAVHHPKINTLLCVPSLYESLLEYSKKSLPLERVILAGEVLTKSLARKHKVRNPSVSLFNEYGPTECSICTTVARIYDIGNPVIDRIPIGKPIQNTAVYILDSQLEPVALRQKGEIFISGMGVSPGYVGDSKTTKKCFFRISMENVIERVYRTGDYGLLNENSEIEFLGRKDDQVKIKGYRIEIGEIREALLEFPGIVQVAITIIQEKSRYLVAFYSSKKLLNEDAIRGFLHRKLPSYMIPQMLIRIKKFPLNANGKIDKNALKRKAKKGTYFASSKKQDAIENLLIQIWKEVLHKSYIVLNDNFFDVGGDSLSIVKVQALIRLKMGQEISITKLFEYPTVSKLSKFLKQEKQDPQKGVVRRPSFLNFRRRSV